MNAFNLALALSICLISIVASAQNSVADVIKPYQYQTRFIKVDDTTKIAYIHEGTGERTLIMIHGLATYLPSWYPVFDQLKTSNQCIALDLPGYGRSSKGDYPGTMDHYSDVLIRLIDELEIRHPVLVGHSMGAQVAITTVLNNSGLFEELVLLAPAGFETFSEQQANWLKSVTTLNVICGATDDQIRTNWSLNFFKMPGSVEFMIRDRLKMKEASDFQLYGQAVVRSVSGMLDGPVFDRLSELNTRTLVVYGENDALIPNKYLHPNLTIREVAESGSAQISDASLALIPECGHFITYDQPEQVSKIIDSFLKE
tara:strand:- start:323 stop:1264 length:942 start_codon:yes stop_codon:yes gene_type:complete